MTLRLNRWEILSLVGALILFLAISILLISQGSPLGHDEAVYSVRARQILRGESVSSWWGLHRAPGLPFILTLAWIGNGTEPYLRLVVALTGLVLITSTWLIARAVVGPKAAVVAAVGTSLSSVVLLSATQVWPDLPGAAVGMAAMCVYAYSLIAQRFRWWAIALLVGLVALATVIRFGAPLPIAIGLIGLTIWKWPAEREGRVLIAVCALGVAGVITLVLMTTLITGDSPPLEGIVARSVHNPRFGGFGDYWDLREQVFTASTMVPLVGAILGLWGSARNPNVRKAFTFPALILAGTFVALATFIHGEVRYLTPVVPWLWIAGAVGLVWASSRVQQAVAIAGAVVVAGVLTLLAPNGADHALALNHGFVNIKNAAESLASDEDCGVLTGYTPQVEWYSGCETAGINRKEVALSSPSGGDGPLYLFLVEKGKRQPGANLLAEYLSETTGNAVIFADPAERYRYVQIWEFDD